MKYIIIYTLVFLIILYSILIYNKTEYFDSYNIKNNNELLFLHKNIFNIENNGMETLFKKSNLNYLSNEFVNNTSYKTGFLFKPINCKNLKIGFCVSNDKMNSNYINYCFHLLDNNYFKIEENNSNINDENEIFVQELDYCFNPSILGCIEKNIFQFKDTDRLCITLNNKRINYIIIKNFNTEKQIGILIHTSKSFTPNNNLYASIINNKNKNKLSDIYWITKKYSEDIKNIEWSINYLSKINYNSKNLPKKQDLNQPTDKKPKYKEPKIYYPRNTRKVIIYKIKLNNDNNEIILNSKNFLLIDLLYHNISLGLLKEIYSIDTIIYLKDKHITIPYKHKNEYFYKYNQMKIDITNNINLLINKDLKIQVVIRPFKNSEHTFLIKSEKKNFKIKEE